MRKKKEKYDQLLKKICPLCLSDMIFCETCNAHIWPKSLGGDRTSIAHIDCDGVFSKVEGMNHLVGRFGEQYGAIWSSEVVSGQFGQYVIMLNGTIPPKQSHVINLSKITRTYDPRLYIIIAKAVHLELFDKMGTKYLEEGGPLVSVIVQCCLRLKNMSISFPHAEYHMTQGDMTWSNRLGWINDLFMMADSINSVITIKEL